MSLNAKAAEFVPGSLRAPTSVHSPSVVVGAGVSSSSPSPPRFNVNAAPFVPGGGSMAGATPAVGLGTSPIPTAAAAAGLSSSVPTGDDGTAEATTLVKPMVPVALSTPPLTDVQRASLTFMGEVRAVEGLSIVVGTAAPPPSVMVRVGGDPPTPPLVVDTSLAALSGTAARGAGVEVSSEGRSSASSAGGAVRALPKPIVVMVLGPRGSGKSSVSAALAMRYNLLHLCAGDMVRAGEKPFTELRKAIEKHFTSAAPLPPSDSSQSTPATPPVADSFIAATTATSPGLQPAEAYNGIVLDRFITEGQADPHYLLHILHSHGLQLDLVLNLQIDSEIALERANSRDEQAEETKPQKDYRRMVEHNALYEACSAVFHPYGALHNLEIDLLSLPLVIEEARKVVDRTILALRQHLAASRRVLPPVPQLCPGVTMVTNVELWQTVEHGIHVALGLPPNEYHMFPGSSMSGLLHELTFAALKKNIKAYFVTWKADGLRILVVWHQVHGWFIVTGKFNCMYSILTDLLKSWPTPQRTLDPALYPVTHILDAELVIFKGVYRVYLFDVLLMNRDLGTRKNFEERYNLLLTFATGTTKKESFFAVKQAVKVGDILELIKKPPPFSEDGLVFQPPLVYSRGDDKDLYKWKPEDKCTADFRLANGKYDEAKDEWTFDGCVLVELDEKPLEGSVIIVSGRLQKQHLLCDGTIVECRVSAASSARQQRSSAAAAAATSTTTTAAVIIWEFLRTRPDKMAPNRHNIAVTIRDMEHMARDTLVEQCVMACNTTPRRSKLEEKLAAKAAAAAAKKKSGE